MIAHLKGREKAIEELGFKPRDAEWIALAALHSGVFLRSQYGRFRGEDGGTARKSATRLLEGLLSRRFATESDSHGISRLCRLHSRAVYRALGAEHIRHRKDAARPDIVRRLLSLDFVLGDIARDWLPTEPEKVSAFEALGIEARILPRRVYGSRNGGRTIRPFGWKMPVALGAGAARFVYVDTGGETHDELLSWGAEHAALWSALANRGIRLEVATVSVSPERLAGAEAIIRGWSERGLRRDSPSGLSAAEREELDRVEEAIAAFDDTAMAQWGGLNGAIALAADLQGRKRDGGNSAQGCKIGVDGVEVRLSALAGLTGLSC